MTDITIPPEALEAAAIADFKAWREYHSRSEEWTDLLPEEQESYRVAARAALLAGLKAWPGMRRYNLSSGLPKEHIILPLPTENSNDR